MKTPVIFRKYRTKDGHWKGGEVVALFVHEPGDGDEYTCLALDANDRVRSVNANSVINDTRPAQLHEYIDLLDHLFRKRYDIRVRLKQNYNDEFTRQDKIRAREATNV